MRIEGERITTRMSGQEWPQFRTEMEERTVRAVDVMPYLLSRAKVGDIVERIYGAVVCRSRTRHHHEWPISELTVSRDRIGQRRGWR